MGSIWMIGSRKGADLRKFSYPHFFSSRFSTLALRDAIIDRHGGQQGVAYSPVHTKSWGEGGCKRLSSLNKTESHLHPWPRLWSKFTCIRKVEIILKFHFQLNKKYKNVTPTSDILLNKCSRSISCKKRPNTFSRSKTNPVFSLLYHSFALYRAF